ncbi:MAG: 50S ribosomal protein L9 [Mycoplasmataceae bacterium]|jgi:large subunit ribosomal protein L9|nr:50S ribosomal protein L9 [Mycoplasmataceae bacterium]
MKIILLSDVKSVGKQHEVVEVKDGYAKNFLIKNKLAVAYTTNAKDVLKQDLQVLAQDEAKKIAEAEALKESIEKVNLLFHLKAFDNNVFGSVSHKQIIDALLEKHQIKIDKFMIDNKTAKNLSLGRYQITINLYKTIKAKLSINIQGVDRG